MDPKTKAEFEKLLSEAANKTCIDCETYNPQWASVSNGVFMCIKCAGTHRSLGVHITFVRSVTMDSWSKMQLARMKCGGNARLRKFWKDQKFPSNLSSKEKYDNEAMEKYRAHLLASAKGDNPCPIEFIGYKANIASPPKFGSNSNSNLNGNKNGASSSSSSLSSMGSGGFGNYDPNENENNQMNDVLSGLSSWTSNFAAKTSVMASDFASKSKQVASQLSEKAALQANEIKTKVNDPNFQSNIKTSANQGWSTMSSWLSSATQSVSKQVSTLYNDATQDGDDNEPVSLYNKHEIDRSKQGSNSKYTNDNAAFSSDQWFEKHPSKYAKNAISSDSYFNNNNNNNNSNDNSHNNNNNNNNNDNNMNDNKNRESNLMDDINDEMENVTIDEHDDELDSDKNDTFEDDWGFDGNSDDDNNHNEKNKNKKESKSNKKVLPKARLPTKDDNNDDDDLDDLLDIGTSNTDKTNAANQASNKTKAANDGGNRKESKGSQNDDDEWGW